MDLTHQDVTKNIDTAIYVLALKESKSYYNADLMTIYELELRQLDTLYSTCRAISLILTPTTFLDRWKGTTITIMGDVDKLFYNRLLHNLKETPLKDYPVDKKTMDDWITKTNNKYDDFYKYDHAMTYDCFQAILSLFNDFIEFKKQIVKFCKCGGMVRNMCQCGYESDIALMKTVRSFNFITTSNPEFKNMIFI